MKKKKNTKTTEIQTGGAFCNLGDGSIRKFTISMVLGILVTLLTVQFMLPILLSEVIHSPQILIAKKLIALLEEGNTHVVHHSLHGKFMKNYKEFLLIRIANSPSIVKTRYAVNCIRILFEEMSKKYDGNSDDPLVIIDTQTIYNKISPFEEGFRNPKQQSSISAPKPRKGKGGGARGRGGADKKPASMMDIFNRSVRRGLQDTGEALNKAADRLSRATTRKPAPTGTVVPPSPLPPPASPRQTMGQRLSNAAQSVRNVSRSAAKSAKDKVDFARGVKGTDREFYSLTPEDNERLYKYYNTNDDPAKKPEYVLNEKFATTFRGKYIPGWADASAYRFFDIMSRLSKRPIESGVDVLCLYLFSLFKNDKLINLMMRIDEVDEKLKINPPVCYVNPSLNMEAALERLRFKNFLRSFGTSARTAVNRGKEGIDYRTQSYWSQADANAQNVGLENKGKPKDQYGLYNIFQNFQSTVICDSEQTVVVEYMKKFFKPIGGREGNWKRTNAVVEGGLKYGSIALRFSSGFMTMQAIDDFKASFEVKEPLNPDDFMYRVLVQAVLLHYFFAQIIGTCAFDLVHWGSGVGDDDANKKPPNSPIRINRNKVSREFSPKDKKRYWDLLNFMEIMRNLNGMLYQMIKLHILALYPEFEIKLTKDGDALEKKPGKQPTEMVSQWDIIIEQIKESVIKEFSARAPAPASIPTPAPDAPAVKTPDKPSLSDYRKNFKDDNADNTAVFEKMKKAVDRILLKDVRIAPFGVNQNYAIININYENADFYPLEVEAVPESPSSEVVDISHESAEAEPGAEQSEAGDGSLSDQDTALTAKNEDEGAQTLQDGEKEIAPKIAQAEKDADKAEKEKDKLEGILNNPKVFEAAHAPLQLENYDNYRIFNLSGTSVSKDTVKSQIIEKLPYLEVMFQFPKNGGIEVKSVKKPIPTSVPAVDEAAEYTKYFTSAEKEVASDSEIDLSTYCRTLVKYILANYIQQNPNNADVIYGHSEFKIDTAPPETLKGLDVKQFQKEDESTYKLFIKFPPIGFNDPNVAKDFPDYIIHPYIYNPYEEEGHETAHTDSALALFEIDEKRANYDIREAIRKFMLIVFTYDDMMENEKNTMDDIFKMNNLKYIEIDTNFEPLIYFDDPVMKYILFTVVEEPAEKDADNEAAKAATATPIIGGENDPANRIYRNSTSYVDQSDAASKVTSKPVAAAPTAQSAAEITARTEQQSAPAPAVTEALNNIPIAVYVTFTRYHRNDQILKLIVKNSELVSVEYPEKNKYKYTSSRLITAAEDEKYTADKIMERINQAAPIVAVDEKIEKVSPIVPIDEKKTPAIKYSYNKEEKEIYAIIESMINLKKQIIGLKQHELQFLHKCGYGELMQVGKTCNTNATINALLLNVFTRTFIIQNYIKRYPKWKDEELIDLKVCLTDNPEPNQKELIIKTFDYYTLLILQNIEKPTFHRISQAGPIKNLDQLTKVILNNYFKTRKTVFEYSLEALQIPYFSSFYNNSLAFYDEGKINDDDNTSMFKYDKYSMSVNHYKPIDNYTFIAGTILMINIPFAHIISIYYCDDKYYTYDSNLDESFEFNFNIFSEKPYIASKYILNLHDSQYLEKLNMDVNAVEGFGNKFSEAYLEDALYIRTDIFEKLKKILV